MNCSPRTQFAAPRWLVTVDDLTDLFVAAVPRLSVFPEPVFPVVFSCSTNGIWPTTSRGFMAEEDRLYIREPGVLLTAVAAQMMSMPDSWMGGRFTITLDGATRTRDGEPIAEFELAA